MAEDDPFPVSNPPPMYEDIFSPEAEATPDLGASAAGANKRSSWSSSDDDDTIPKTSAAAFSGANLFSTEPPPLPGGLIFPEAEEVEALTGLFGASSMSSAAKVEATTAPVSCCTDLLCKIAR